MNYKGIELKDIADTPQLVDPPRLMFVWDRDDGPLKKEGVFAIVASLDPDFRVIAETDRYAHCAEIPEEPSPRRATCRQVSRWLAEGNGEVRCGRGDVTTVLCYFGAVEDRECDSSVKVRKWDDEDWNEPTLEYLRLQE